MYLRSSVRNLECSIAAERKIIWIETVVLFTWRFSLVLFLKAQVLEHNQVSLHIACI